MRRYGGLRVAMPVTFVTFGWVIRIIGFRRSPASSPKDAIIEPLSPQMVCKAGCRRGAVGAGITAFYMTRVMLMTFFGEDAGSPTPPPRVTGHHDGADGGARSRIGGCGRAAGARGGWPPGSKPVTGPRVKHHEAPVWLLTAITLGSSRSAC
jgi:NADH-quinone oxidoreductase subunit L